MRKLINQENIGKRHITFFWVNYRIAVEKLHINSKVHYLFELTYSIGSY